MLRLHCSCLLLCSYVCGDNVDASMFLLVDVSDVFDNLVATFWELSSVGPDEGGTNPWSPYMYPLNVSVHNEASSVSTNVRYSRGIL
jgi:hypothetical protein